MISLQKLLFESIGDREFERDLMDIQNEVEQEWYNGQKHQSWRLVPARDLLYVWNTYVKYGRVEERRLEKIWDILKECAIKILLNSDWWRGDMAILFGKDDEDELTSDDYERFAQFMGDGHSKLWRGTGDAHGMGRYTDQARRLYEFLMKGYRAQTPEEKIMAVDLLINFVHGSGNMAKWFIEGGVNTLNHQRDIQTKGIHLTGKLSENFYGSFEASRVGKSNYTEIFKNPSARELKPLVSDREFGAVLLGRDIYVWNRDLALHGEVMRHIKGDVQEMLPVMVIVDGSKFAVYVTDAANRTKWYRQPEAAYYIKDHPYFRGKVEDISYWDEDINGKWGEPEPEYPPTYD